MTHTAMTSIDALESWFRKIAKPQWNLYRGHNNTMSRAHSLYRQGEDTMSIDESWELLRDMININCGNGGQFTVYIPAAATGNTGYSVFVSIGMEAHSRSRYPGAAVGGFPTEGAVSLGQVQDLIAKERKVWELERKVEDLEAQQEASLGMTDVVKNMLQNVDLTPILTSLVNFATSRFGGVQPPLPVRLSGHPDDELPAESATDAPPAQAPAYDGRRLKVTMDKIRPHFQEDEDFYQFLDAVADAFAANPQFFKNQFGYA